MFFWLYDLSVIASPSSMENPTVSQVSLLKSALQCLVVLRLVRPTLLPSLELVEADLMPLLRKRHMLIAGISRVLENRKISFELQLV